MNTPNRRTPFEPQKPHYISRLWRAAEEIKVQHNAARWTAGLSALNVVTAVAFGVGATTPLGWGVVGIWGLVAAINVVRAKKHFLLRDAALDVFSKAASEAGEKGLLCAEMARKNPKKAMDMFDEIVEIERQTPRPERVMAPDLLGAPARRQIAPGVTEVVLDIEPAQELAVGGHDVVRGIIERPKKP